ncbi:hypothetical protein KDA23_06765, partial [Candidatus Saccharibacteria bacterium]|nr:hypothetical protein [Candidatus Saccharibacteria bacterium]
MARVAITEYAAKRLCFGDLYKGVTATSTDIAAVVGGLTDEDTFVVKVDVGIKKRGKQGLLAVNVPKNKVILASEPLFEAGHERVLIEPYVSHETAGERYLSIELTREGARVLHAEQGGVE